MAAAIAFASSAGDASNLTAYTFTAQAIGTASADRYVAVGAMSVNIGGSVPISSMTIGGVSATKLVAADYDGGAFHDYAEIWMAPVPTGTTGDVVITWGGGMLRCGIVVWAITGLTSTTPTDTKTATGTTLSVSLNVPASGVALAMEYNDNTSSSTWTGLTEDADAIVDTDGYSGASLASAGGNPALTVTATVASSSIGDVLAVCSLDGGAVAGGQPTRKRFGGVAHMGGQTSFGRGSGMW